MIMTFEKLRSNVSNAKDGVSSDFQTLRRELKIRRAQRSIFDEIRGVWVCDETLSRVFDISSKSKQKQKSKRRNKIVKI